MTTESEASLEALRALERGIRDEFATNKRVLSFDEYFQLFTEQPTLHCRTAPQYLRDCLDHYGTLRVRGPGGEVLRYRLFDCPWEDGDDGGVKFRVVGQEEAQEELYRILVNFVREGRVARLVLLHGPNGSAKSSFIQCLARGLEDYSTRDEGAIYRFNWVFPSSRVAKKRLGFADRDELRGLDSFAHLDEEDIDARIPADLRDHPLLLVPKERRRRILGPLLDRAAADGDDFHAGDYLLEGDLAPRSRAIADTLLNAYHGDFQRVLQHVQVERFFFSRRYRRGVVTIEPQLHVDASVRQVTMDQGLQALPPSLRSLSLYEPFGDLVDANRGLIEYNDLLKKPLDSYKYLLATCEKGTVALPNAILHLDLLFLASSNERHLSAFKEYQDFPSFKGRMDLVKMPYLRDYKVEQSIYQEQIASGGLQAMVVPHSTFVIALWAVLTRLRRPQKERYPESIRPVIEKLTTLEKAELYAGVREPAELSSEHRRDLRAQLQTLLAEGQEDADYEGSFGASPREMKEVMLNALQADHHFGLSPLGIFDELAELVKLRSVYEFLKREPVAGYHDAAAFIEQVRERWLDRVDIEVRTAMGLISSTQYVELFSRYILHVNYLLKGEKVYSEATGRSEDPDTTLMEKLEGIWNAPKDREGFRRDLVGRVGAWRLDHPGADIDYRRLFPRLFQQLEDDYYKEQRETIRKLANHVLEILTAEEQPGRRHGSAADHLDAAERATAEATIEQLVSEYGYPRPAVREALGALLTHRYQ